MSKWLALLALCFALPAFAQRPDLLEVVEISGEISESTASQVSQAVEAINENPKIKAVLLIVKSPGGGVSASAEIYAALSRLKAPVVGWCDYLCASGGIYVMMSPGVKFVALTDQAITGSVGVMAQITRFNRLLEWLKIDNDVYKSGGLKSAGNPTQEPTEAERKYLQGLVDEFASRFYGVVRKARPKLTDWEGIKSARIFIGEEAVKAGLVDAVMDRAGAIKKAKELSGSKNIYTREELKKMSRAADDRSSYGFSPSPIPVFGDVPWLIEALKEIRRGETVRFSYRMPYEF